jgi:hypothetical protein
VEINVAALWHNRKYFLQKYFLQGRLICGTAYCILRHMKEQTKARTVRLPLSTWEKFTELMNHFGGRVWLEQAINRLHKRVFGK